MDQLFLAELCHSKLGSLHPEPGEVLTWKWRTESPEAARLRTKMLYGLKKKKKKKEKNRSLSCIAGGMRGGSQIEE